MSHTHLYLITQIVDYEMKRSFDRKHEKKKSTRLKWKRTIGGRSKSSRFGSKSSRFGSNRVDSNRNRVDSDRDQGKLALRSDRGGERGSRVDRNEIEGVEKISEGDATKEDWHVTTHDAKKSDRKQHKRAPIETRSGGRPL